MVCCAWFISYCSTSCMHVCISAGFFCLHLYLISSPVSVLFSWPRFLWFPLCLALFSAQTRCCFPVTLLVCLFSSLPSLPTPHPLPPGQACSVASSPCSWLLTRSWGSLNVFNPPQKCHPVPFLRGLNLCCVTPASGACCSPVTLHGWGDSAGWDHGL